MTRSMCHPSGPNRLTAASDKRATMWETWLSDGAVPWWRHTTIGVSHTSQSATQQMSSSWYQWVKRAASHNSQVGSDGGG